MNSKKIELLAPAGSPEALDAAIGEGADAVYLGIKDFNARLYAKNFSYRHLEACIDKLHSINKKIYVALNTVFIERETDKVYNILKYLNSVKPDAVIVQDIGIINLINHYFKELKIHASTQMNISSGKGVNFLSKYGVSRIILGRELGFEEIKKIRLNTNIELEIFVHGSLCASVSGLCLFSSFLSSRSANRGTCIQTCRHLYSGDKAKGFFFSSNDLMLLEEVPDIINAGINSLKIEGRMKNSNYVSAVVKAYRHVIDNCINDPELAVKQGLEILKNDFSRKKTKYFFLNKNYDYLNPNQEGGTGLFLGKIKEIKIIKKQRFGLISSKADLSADDVLRFHSASLIFRKSKKIAEIIKDENGVFVPVFDEINIGDSVYLIEKSEFKKKYPFILPKSLDKYKRHPGINPCPDLKKISIGKEKLKTFSAGIYIKISNFKDLYLTQSIRPEKIILNFNKKNIEEFKKNFEGLSYKNEDIIFYLEPYFSYNDEEFLDKNIDFCIKNNLRYFIVNNFGHINLLKRKDACMISGPFLYSFNKYALEFLYKSGCNFFISPLENSRDNLIESSDLFNREFWLVTLFCFPELFYINADLSRKYEFNLIKNDKNDIFNIIYSGYKTSVIPQKPFSILDRKLELKKIGFNKFIIDFSNINLTKNFYKHIMHLAVSEKNFEGSARFNWKKGFYRV